MMRTTVWVVLVGFYEGLVGVFATEADAQKVRDRAGDLDLEDVIIREVPLNPIIQEIDAGYRFFWVDVSADGVAGDPEPEDIDLRELFGRDWQIGGGTAFPLALRVAVWARDESHAKELAIERWQQRVSEGAFPKL